MHFEYIEISVPSTNSCSLTRRPFLHPVFTAQLCCFKKIQLLLEKIQSRTVLAGLIERSDFSEFCHNWSCSLFKSWLTILPLLVPRSHSHWVYVQCMHGTQDKRDKKVGQYSMAGCKKGTTTKKYGATYEEGYTIWEREIFFLPMCSRKQSVCINVKCRSRNSPLTLYVILTSYLKHLSLSKWLIWGRCHWIMQSFWFLSHLTVTSEGGMSFSEMIQSRIQIIM